MQRKKYTVLSILLGLALLGGCAGQSTQQSKPDTPAQTAAEQAEESEQAAESAQTTAKSAQLEKAQTTHVSPTESVTSVLGIERSDLNLSLDKNDEEKNHANLPLEGWLPDGAVVESFTFVIETSAATVPLGNYQGGYGISVTEDCPAGKDGWVQAEDFEQSINSSYAELTWTVPEEIAPYVDPAGEVLFGHWWSDVDRVQLSSAVCTYRLTQEIPVDGTTTQNPGVSLRYADEAEKTAEIPLNTLIGEEDTLQTVTLRLSAAQPLKKYVGGIGVTLKEDAAHATDEGWYQSDSFVVFTQENSAELTWIVPPEIQGEIDPSGVLSVGYWWSEADTVSLDEVSVRYSNSTGTTTEVKAPTGGSVKAQTSDLPTAEEVNAMTSAQIVEAIRVGWNLGNTLDSHDTKSADTETGWGNPKTTKEMIGAVKAAGFNAVRIPVTWGEHMSADGTIEEEWMNRVQEVVDYAYDEGLFVILNVHHDDAIWLTPSAQKLEEDKAILTRVWTQICDRFGDYDHRLLFEGMNEPRMIGTPEEWTGGTQENWDVINALYQAFADTVRSSGKNNAERTIIVSSYAQSIEKKAVEAVVVPQDSHVIVSFHSYAPWKFCGDEDSDSDWGTQADKDELDANFRYLHDTFAAKGVPVIIDEFGSVNKDNTADRAAWYAYYVSAAAKQGIKCFVWDNNIITKQSAFGLFDRKNLSWYYPEIIDAIMQAV